MRLRNEADLKTAYVQHSDMPFDAAFGPAATNAQAPPESQRTFGVLSAFSNVPLHQHSRLLKDPDG